MRWFIIPLLLLPFLSEGQQIRFNKYYEKPQGQNVQGVATHELPSGNLFSINRTASGPYLLKTDPLGNTIWDTLIADGRKPFQVLTRSNGNFLVVGTKDNLTYVAEMDSIGNYSWLNPTFDSSSTDFSLGGLEVKELDSGKFAVLILSKQSGPSKIHEYDSIGNLTNSFALQEKINGFDVALDSGYILVGSDTLPGSMLGETIPLLIKVSRDGNIIWRKTYDHLYGSAVFHQAMEVLTVDSTYLVGFQYYEPFLLWDDFTVMGSLFEFNKNGDTIRNPNLRSYLSPLTYWQGDTTYTKAFVPVYFKKEHGGNLIISSFGYACYTPWMNTCLIEGAHQEIIKLGNDFNEIWTRKVPWSWGTHGANNISLTAKGGFLFTGHSERTVLSVDDGSINWDVERLKIVRFDSLGNTTVDIEVPIGKSTVFTFYPNPTSSRISISSHESFRSLEIIDLLGNSIYKTQDLENIDLSEVPNGLYIIRAELRDTGETVSSKIMIRH